MLRVTIELVPYGIEDRKRTLATAIIANDGSGSQERGNYTCIFSQSGRPTQKWRHAVVQGFRRLRKGSWHLLLEALKNAINEKSGG